MFVGFVDGTAGVGAGRPAAAHGKVARAGRNIERQLVEVEWEWLRGPCGPLAGRCEWSGATPALSAPGGDAQRHYGDQTRAWHGYRLWR